MHDAADQLTGVTYSDGTTPNVTYSYDAGGQRTKMVDGSGTTSYAYDALHRLTDVTDGNGVHVGYRYDLASRQTGVVYPSGNTLLRTYDPAGRVTTQDDGSGRLTRFAYDPDGDLTAITRPDSTTSARTFDAAGRLTRITDTGPGGATILDIPYTYDAASRLTDATVHAGTTGVPTNGYGYDNGDNLVRISTDGVDTTLLHDAADQLLSATSAAGTTTYSNDTRGDRTGWTDAVGNTASYGYDQANRLTSSVGPPLTKLNQLGAASTSVGYTYNGDGLRMQKRVVLNGASVALRESWDVTASVPLMLVGDRVNSVLSVTPDTFVYAPDGTPLEQISGTALFFHTDRLGSVRAITDQQGAVVATVNYDPYGKVTAGSATAATPLGYAGQYTDPETGLIYLRARYYDPTTGSFLTRDPITSITQAPYTYVDDDPLDGTDPSGLCTLGVFGKHCHIAKTLTVAAAVVGGVALVIGTGGVAAAAAPELIAGFEAADLAATTIAEGAELIEYGQGLATASSYLSGASTILSGAATADICSHGLSANCVASGLLTLAGGAATYGGFVTPATEALGSLGLGVLGFALDLGGFVDYDRLLRGRC